jgi:hypothetical protein
MNLSANLRNAAQVFLSHLQAGPGAGGLMIYDQPTEQIREAALAGKQLRLSGMASPRGGIRALVQKKDVRYEENYLYSTRRFPNNTANDTIGAGAVTGGDYDFFGNGVGDAVTTMGYFTAAGTALTYLHTNMDRGGKIPQGRAFRLYELGISFNARAKANDIGQLMDCLSLRYEKQGGQLVVQHGPVKLWPGGTGVSGFSTNTAAEGSANGVAQMGSVRRFKLARELDANESFKYTLNAPSATRYVDGSAIALSTFVEVTIWLYGLTQDRIPT